ncbi:MAG TPA: glycosyltransferase family 2 protein [Acidimicrobiales bacterium]|nr:glycosyltransferase family 2 protein [Acidimicrobiales bacterium]
MAEEPPLPGSTGGGRGGGETISVIVPAYNAAEFLDATLASVVAQSRAPDEVVVLDDASTDDTAVVAKRWADLLPLVLVERRQNEGLGAARQLAIEHSSGSLIALLDSDDYWLPDHLAVLQAAWERAGGVVTADKIDWVPGRRLSRTSWAESVAIPAPELQAQAIISGNFGLYCSLFSRADYEAAGGFRPLRKSEDWDLWIRMVRSGSPLRVAPTPTVIYRKRPDSLSANNGCIGAEIAILEGLCQEVGPDEQPIVHRALRLYRARHEYLAAFADVADGSVSRARWRWLRAAARDRRVGRGPGGYPSVALRAVACSVAPRRALAIQRSRQSDVKLLAK